MTYVIRSSGKKEEFDGEKLISSIMAAANDAGLMKEAGIQDIIKNIGSNTISYAQNQKEVPTKTLKDAILAQVLKMGIQMAIQKFGASNVTKEDIISELISAGLQMSTKSSNSGSSDILSQLLGAATGTSSKTSSSNDILSQLLGAATETNSKTTQSNDILSQLLGAATGTSSKTSSSNDNLESILKTGMKLANAWMQYNK